MLCTDGSAPRKALEYMLDSLPIVKRRDIARTIDRMKVSEGSSQACSYSTKDKVLEIYDLMQRAQESGQPFRSELCPSPGSPTCS